MKKSTLAIIIIILAIALGYYLFTKNEKKEISTQKNRTIAECVTLSKEVKINENTKNCFDNLSNDEFLSLVDPKNKDAMDLYNEVEAHYDTRTEAQKKADAETNKEFFNKIIESNPKVFNK